MARAIVAKGRWANGRCAVEPRARGSGDGDGKGGKGGGGAAARREEKRGAEATATATATATVTAVDEEDGDEAKMDEDEPRLRVLLATDDERTRTMSAALLGELGAECVVAKSANEVLEALKRARMAKTTREANEQVDMILLDVLMPECEGEVELTEACRKNEALRGVPIVVMSTVDERKESAAGGTRRRARRDFSINRSIASNSRRV